VKRRDLIVRLEEIGCILSAMVESMITSGSGLTFDTDKEVF
jgi:hypothetical protein